VDRAEVSCSLLGVRQPAVPRPEWLDPIERLGEKLTSEVPSRRSAEVLSRYPDDPGGCTALTHCEAVTLGDIAGSIRIEEQRQHGPADATSRVAILLEGNQDLLRLCRRRFKRPFLSYRGDQINDAAVDASTLKHVLPRLGFHEGVLLSVYPLLTGCVT
jgi:hypothetical protein